MGAWKKVLTTIGVLAMGLIPVAPTSADDANTATGFRNVTALDMALWMPDTLPDARLRYAEDSPVQYGDLRLPSGAPPPDGHPVVVFVHGGGWLADWTKDYGERFVEALTRAGYATWDLEFRRMGNQGGGYPGTFLDVGAGTDHLRILAQRYPLDLKRVVAVGHSSGGHLAVWLAGRKNLPASSPLRVDNPLPLAGVVSLAGVNDLGRSLALGNRTDALKLSGIESPDDAEARFAETDPARLLPFGIPQALIVGSLDGEWRVAMTRAYAEDVRAAGDPVTVDVPEGANHFDVVDAESAALGMVTAAIRTMIGGPAPE